MIPITVNDKKFATDDEAFEYIREQYSGFYDKSICEDRIEQLKLNRPHVEELFKQANLKGMTMTYALIKEKKDVSY